MDFCIRLNDDEQTHFVPNFTKILFLNALFTPPFQKILGKGSFFKKNLSDLESFPKLKTSYPALLKSKIKTKITLVTAKTKLQRLQFSTSSSFVKF